MKEKKFRRTRDTCDRISHLPEEILRRILSFVPTEDAIRTSFLSKKWRYLWTSVPILDLHEFHFSKNSVLVDFYDALMVRKGSFDYNSIEISKQRKQFADFVDRSLLLHEGQSLLGFAICFHYCENYKFTSRVDQWIRFAFTSNATMLNLDFTGGTLRRDPISENPYKLPPCRFSPKFLTFLRLNFCQFRPLEYKSFAYLKTAVLKQVKLADAFVHDLISSCPRLENLYLFKCFVPHHFVINASGSQLKRMVVNSCLCYMDGPIDMYEINAPSLLHFTFVGKMLEVFSVKNLSNLIDTNIEFKQDFFFDIHGDMVSDLLMELNHANAISLSSWCLQVLPIKQELDVLRDRLPTPLYNLKHLILNTGLDNCGLLGIACLLRSSPNLETLSIHIGYSVDMNWEYLDEFEFTDMFDFDKGTFWELQSLPFNCLLHHLKKIELSGFQGRDYEIELVRFLLKNSMLLKEMVITLVDLRPRFAFLMWEHYEERLNSLQAQLQTCRKLLAFPRASNCAELLLL